MSEHESSLQQEPYKDGFVVGIRMGVREVRYRVRRGLAFFEGDIVLGTVEEMDKLREKVESPTFQENKAAILSSSHRRWPKGVIPFRIDPTLTNAQRVRDAIQHVQSLTKLRFRKKTGADQNFVTFRFGPECSSLVGMHGGEQFVDVSDECVVGEIVHEICHAAGLWHEQSREDRDKHIFILKENMQPGADPEFDQHITDGDDVGDYDFGSIMHYPETAFSRNGKPTIRPKHPVPHGVVMGQRERLSDGDIAAINFLYP